MNHDRKLFPILIKNRNVAKETSAKKIHMHLKSEDLAQIFWIGE